MIGVFYFLDKFEIFQRIIVKIEIEAVFRHFECDAELILIHGFIDPLLFLINTVVAGYGARVDFKIPEYFFAGLDNLKGIEKHFFRIRYTKFLFEGAVGTLYDRGAVCGAEIRRHFNRVFL